MLLLFCFFFSSENEVVGMIPKQHPYSYMYNFMFNNVTDYKQYILKHFTQQKEKAALQSLASQSMLFRRLLTQ